jgi:hypothetical protein
VNRRILYGEGEEEEEDESSLLLREWKGSSGWTPRAQQTRCLDFRFEKHFQSEAKTPLLLFMYLSVISFTVGKHKP